MVSAANCGGLIEAGAKGLNGVRQQLVSAAYCGGLIEARVMGLSFPKSAWFPPQIASASLKLDQDAVKHRVEKGFSVANCGGLIEAL